MKKEKQFTFKEFKEFLAENCFDERLFGEGRYDKKIYNWFEVGKPRKVEFFTKEKGKMRFVIPKKVSTPKIVKFYTEK